MTTNIQTEGAMPARRIHPPVDIRETPEGIRLVVEMPGARSDTISVNVEDDTLSLSAEKTEPEATHRFVHRETPSGRYERTFRLSRDLDREGVSARYREGLLTILLPKAEHSKPHRIQVQSE